METSPSQSSGQSGGVRWSVQTDQPAAVTNGFHQGAHGLTGETYMETSAKGADIYLPAAPHSTAQHWKKGAGLGSVEKKDKEVCKPLLKAFIEQPNVDCTNPANGLWRV